MRENCSSGSVGERRGNEPLYTEKFSYFLLPTSYFLFFVVLNSDQINSV